MPKDLYRALQKKRVRKSPRISPATFGQTVDTKRRNMKPIESDWIDQPSPILSAKFPSISFSNACQIQ
ncbi:hypothetical protein niasHS_013935 [Heterodera schachtii]|uniref:Uncharacterized protein n=1 Tax=Heterodera schachtii TaxID=97005 RepID=A0ABD2J220_HETSC